MNTSFLRKVKLVILLLLSQSLVVLGQTPSETLDYLDDLFVSREYFERANLARDLVQQSDRNAVNDLGNNYEMLQGQVNALQSGFEHLNSLLSLAGGTMELYGALRTLDNQECAPDFQLGAGALMPSSCLDSARSDGCSDCYENALARLQTVRRGMARMRCIYMNTRNFKDKALSFGDNVAGLHGAIGIVWQGQRRGIEQSYANFEVSYDRKYTDFIGSLHEALLAVSDCENRFGTRDWYQRFGFMFEEIMKEKYKRTD